MERRTGAQPDGPEHAALRFTARTRACLGSIAPTVVVVVQEVRGERNVVTGESGTSAYREQRLRGGGRQGR